MTVKNGDVVKDDVNSRSQYKTNIVLGAKLEDSDRDRKSLWVLKRKSLKDIQSLKAGNRNFVLCQRKKKTYC